MKAIADINLVVVGGDISLSPYVAACVKVFRERGLKTHIHALGSNVEGDMGDVLSAIGACHSLVHNMGAGRVITTVKFTTRTDRDQTLEEKVQSVVSLIEQ